MTAGSYVARIVDVPDHGIRLEPTEDSVRPDRPDKTNLLALAVALTLGASGYHHHPEPRDPELQTLDALLAGEAVMPWLGIASAGDHTFIVCETSEAGPPACRLEQRPS
jgi:hypothetical protein